MTRVIEGVCVQSCSVTQAVKAVCALLGNVETLDITFALDAFSRACTQLSLVGSLCTYVDYNLEIIASHVQLIRSAEHVFNSHL